MSEGTPHYLVGGLFFLIGALLFLVGSLLRFQTGETGIRASDQFYETALEAYRDVADEACSKTCKAEGATGSLPTYLQGAPLGNVHDRRDVVCWCVGDHRKWKPTTYP